MRTTWAQIALDILVIIVCVTVAAGLAAFAGGCGRGPAVGCTLPKNGFITDQNPPAHGSGCQMPRRD